MENENEKKKKEKERKKGKRKKGKNIIKKVNESIKTWKDHSCDQR